jgi:hypothetical protein
VSTSRTQQLADESQQTLTWYDLAPKATDRPSADEIHRLRDRKRKPPTFKRPSGDPIPIL